jgi:hypothetical protein
MKISYRTHPILEKMELGSLGKMLIDDLDKPFFDQHNSEFVYWWKRYLPNFKKSIIKISDSFYDSCREASGKLMDLYGDIVGNNKSDFNVACTILRKNVSMMFYYSSKKESDFIEIALFLFTKAGIPIAYYINNSTTHDEIAWISQRFPQKTEDEITHFCYLFIKESLVIYMFKQYAQVETKYLPAGQKAEGIDCKYINDTKSNITYLDSKWFTTLVKSDAFKVRGHFRLQPKKKDGEWTKELIWITDFEKHGYTAPARKLTHAR